MSRGVGEKDPRFSDSPILRLINTPALRFTLLDSYFPRMALQIFAPAFPEFMDGSGLERAKGFLPASRPDDHHLLDLFGFGQAEVDARIVAGEVAVGPLDQAPLTPA